MITPALFVEPVPGFFDERAGHIAAFGSSGTGKTRFLTSLCRARLRDPRWGLLVLDVEGDITPACLEYVANPQHGLHWRKVHVLRPASTTHAFALPLLHAPARTPLACCQVSVRALAVFEQFVSFGAPEYGPRLSKLFLLGCFGLSLIGRPLIDLPELFAVGADELRRSIAEVFPYQFLRGEFRALDVLHPRAFVEYRDALMSRLLPLFSNPILRRVYGPQGPVDLAHVLRRREALLLDLSGLEHREAVLIGSSFISIVFHEALQRAPDVEPHTTLLVDEAFDFINADLARGFDRLRKRNVQLVLACQRLGALQ